VDQYHKSGYCQAGFSVAMAAVSLATRTLFTSQNYLSICAQRFERTQVISFQRTQLSLLKFVQTYVEVLSNTIPPNQANDYLFSIFLACCFFGLLIACVLLGVGKACTEVLLIR
jgi:hypothetical protein